MGSGASKNDGTTTTSHGNKIEKYQNGKPSVYADDVFGCFSTADEKGNIISAPGSLYRLVNRQAGQWYFYNDTRSYDMVVLGYFGAMNVLRVLGRTKMYREMPSGLLIATTVVEPLETTGYIEGAVRDGFDLQFKAVRRLNNGESDVQAIAALTRQATGAPPPPLPPPPAGVMMHTQQPQTQTQQQQQEEDMQRRDSLVLAPPPAFPGTMHPHTNAGEDEDEDEGDDGGQSNSNSNGYSSQGTTQPHSEHHAVIME